MSRSLSKVRPMAMPGRLQVSSQDRYQPLRNYRYPVPPSLPVANRDLSPHKVQILDTKTKGLTKPEPASV